MKLYDVPALARASAQYRDERAALLDEERALLDRIERVAQRRRALPAGPRIEDAALTGADGSETTLGALFGSSNVLLAYNMMYAPGDEAPCPMCARWVDGFNALADRVHDVVPFVVLSRAAPAKLARLAQARGWALPLYSAPSSFGRDIGAEDAEGDQQPIVSVFRRSPDGAITLWYSQSAQLPDEELRGIDLLNPLWHLLDLLPNGRGDYTPPPIVVQS